MEVLNINVIIIIIIIIIVIIIIIIIIIISFTCVMLPWIVHVYALYGSMSPLSLQGYSSLQYPFDALITTTIIIIIIVSIIIIIS